MSYKYIENNSRLNIQLYNSSLRIPMPKQNSLDDFKYNFNTHARIEFVFDSMICRIFKYFRNK